MAGALELELVGGMGMVASDIPFLSLLIVLPLAGSLLVFFLPARWARWLALAFSLAPLVISIHIYGLVWDSPAPAGAGYLSAGSLHF